MIGGLADGVDGITGQILRGVLNPALSNSLLALLGERGQLFAPLLHNTVSPTILRTSQKINVIPSEVSVELDGRMLPGYRPDNMLAELRRILAPEVEIEVIRHDPGPAEPNMGLFETLANILRQADPQAVVVPLLLSGVTDARFSPAWYPDLWILPMQLPVDLISSERFTRLMSVSRLKQ
jgi:acetylornithine deacetylase/succinyl-diaminopimelate desuccinylase-like protein